MDDSPKPSPVTMAMLRACETMMDSRLVTTIPVRELFQFSKALLDAYGVALGEAAKQHGCTYPNCAGEPKDDGHGCCACPTGAGEPIPMGECAAPDCDCEPGWCRQRVPATFRRKAPINPADGVSLVDGQAKQRSGPDGSQNG